MWPFTAKNKKPAQDHWMCDWDFDYRTEQLGNAGLRQRLIDCVGTDDPVEIRRMLDQAKDGWRPPGPSLQDVARKIGVDLPSATD